MTGGPVDADECLKVAQREAKSLGVFFGCPIVSLFRSGIFNR